MSTTNTLLTQLRLFRSPKLLFSMLLATSALLFAACDQDAPPAPFVDALPSTTSLDFVVVQGSAEPNAVIRIEGGAATVETVADPFTARFRLRVALNTSPAEGETVVENELRITALDEAENQSDAALNAEGNVPVVVFELPKAEGMTLKLSANRISADVGEVVAMAQIHNDEIDDLSGFEVRFELVGIEGVDAQTLTTDVDGKAKATFTELRVAILEATLLATANASAFANASFSVEAGAAASLDMQLFNSTQDPTLQTPLTAPVVLGVGEELSAEMQVSDAFGNLRSDAVSLTSDIPNAALIGFSLVNVEQTGLYRVVGSVIGSDVSALRNVEYQAGAPHHVVIDGSAAFAQAGELLELSARVEDEFGNTLSQEATLSATDDLSGHMDCTEVEGFVSTNTFRTCHSGVVTFIGSFAGLEDAAFEVLVGPSDPANLSGFALTGDAADGVISAGEDVTYTYTATDAFGNPVTDPVSLVVNHPGALVLDDGRSGQGTITGMTHASSAPYILTARVGSSAVVQTLNVEVTPAQGLRTLRSSLSLSSMAINDTVLAFATVQDLYGNPISSPSPSFDVTLADGSDASGRYVIANGNELTISEAGVYKIVATFDDGVNPVAGSDSYLLVENVPDLTPPVISVSRINGVDICPFGSALAGYASTDCSLTEPDLSVGRGAPVLVELNVDDDRGISKVSFKAFGAGVTQDDFTLVGAGDHTPGTPLSVTFFFPVNNTAVPGDVSIVAAAEDTSGNQQNTRAALLRIDLGLNVANGRTLETVVGGDLFGGILLSDPRGIAVDGNGDIFIANRDTDQAVYRVQNQAVVQVATFADEPEYLAFDAAGNMYVALNNRDEVIQVDPAGNQVLYSDVAGDPEGLSVLSEATPGTGRFLFNGNVNDASQVDIEGQVYEFDVAGGCAGGVICVPFDGSRADAATQLAAAINAFEVVVEAARADSCNNNGNPCVVLVATVAGTAGLPIVLQGGGNILSDDVTRGEDASLLYVGDAASNNIFELQAPNDAMAGPIRNYNMGQNARGIATHIAGTPARLLLYSVDDGSDELIEYDTATRERRRIARNNDGLNKVYGVVLRTSTDPLDPPVCAIVINDGGNGEIIAYDVRDPATPGYVAPEIIASGFSATRGMALEGVDQDANLLVTDRGINIVVRIRPTPAAGDCF